MSECDDVMRSLKVFMASATDDPKVRRTVILQAALMALEKHACSRSSGDLDASDLAHALSSFIANFYSDGSQAEPYRGDGGNVVSLERRRVGRGRP